MKLLSIISLIVLAAWGAPVLGAEVSSVTGTITSVKPSERIVRVRDNVSRERNDYHIPEGATITMGGKPARLNRVMVGHTVTLRFTEPAQGPREVVSLGVPEPERIADVPAASEEAPMAQVARAELPKTASSMPAFALLGLALLGAGFVMRLARRRA